jgi:hypothetical protein
MPRGAFCISFEIKPRSIYQGALLRSFGKNYGAVSLSLIEGALAATFINHQHEKFELRTEAVLQAEQWYHVTLAYDLSTFSIELDGIPAAKCPAHGMGKRFTPLIFGGHGNNTNYFHGFLKSFRIAHRADLL